MKLLKIDFKRLGFIFFGFFLVLSPLLVQSQTRETSYFLNQLSTASTGSEVRVNDKGDTILVSTYGGANVQLNTQMRMEVKYLGTPYYRNLWFKGQARLKGGEPSKGVLAFNVVKGVVYFASQGSNLPAIEVKPERFALDGLVFYNFEDVYEGASTFYYNILVNSEPKLLKQYSGRYVQTKGDVEDAYGDSSTQEYEGKFLKEEAYYFVIQNQLVLVNRKKSFIKSLGPYEQKAKKIVQQEKLNLKKQSDIIKLAEMLQI